MAVTQKMPSSNKHCIGKPHKMKIVIRQSATELFQAIINDGSFLSSLIVYKTKNALHTLSEGKSPKR